MQNISMTILVMFSGGLDSTGALYRLLTETDSQLHVHHIDIQNIENRWIPERYATAKIIDLCQKFRNFKFSTSTYEFLQFKNFFTWDNDIVRFVAAQIARDDPNINKVALGKCADDENPAFRLRALQSQTIWNACFLGSDKSPPEIIRPVETMTKKQIWDMLPDNFKDYIWSCRTPRISNKTYSYCLTCNTCQTMLNYGILNTTPTEPKNNQS